MPRGWVFVGVGAAQCTNPQSRIRLAALREIGGSESRRDSSGIKNRLKRPPVGIVRGQKGTKKMKKTTKSNRKTTTKKKEKKTMNQQEQKFTDAQVARARKNREELAKTSEKFREFLETNRAARRAEYKGATGQQVAEIVTSVPLKYLGCNSLNDFLKVDYREQTGAETFATFEQWKAQGKSVKKGERGFPIWSKPRKVEVKTETGTQTVTRYSLAYIFHEGQVRENEKNEKN